MKEEVYFLQDLFNTIQKKAKSKEKNYFVIYNLIQAHGLFLVPCYQFTLAYPLQK